MCSAAHLANMVLKSDPSWDVSSLHGGRGGSGLLMCSASREFSHIPHLLCQYLFFLKKSTHLGLSPTYSSPLTVWLSNAVILRETRNTSQAGGGCWVQPCPLSQRQRGLQDVQRQTFPSTTENGGCLQGWLGGGWQPPVLHPREMALSSHGHSSWSGSCCWGVELNRMF